MTLIEAEETQLSKRTKGCLWITLAGIISTILLLVVENIGMFQLTDNWKLIVVILGTAIVSQITKWLNS